MPTIKGSSLDGPTDAVADRAIARGIRRQAYDATHDIPANDPEFLKKAGIRNDDLPPDVPSPSAGGKIIDAADKLTTVGWNAQFAVPAAAGIGGWLAKRGNALGPVLGAPLRGLGTLFGMPQEALKLQAEDIAHFKSGRIFRAAKRHMASAEMLHGKALASLDKADDALKADGLGSVREALAGVKSAHTDIHDAVPVGAVAGHGLGREGAARSVSAGKISSLDARAGNEAFEAAVARRQAQGSLSARETKAIAKAREHMKDFVGSTAKAQEQAAMATPLRAQAMGVAKQEVEKRNAFLGKAETRLTSTSEKIEQTVGKSKPLSWARDKAGAFFERSASRHAANAEKIHATAMKRLDAVIEAVPSDEKFSGLRGILTNARDKYGALPATSDREALERVATSFSQVEKRFGEEAARLGSEGGLNPAEKALLGKVEKKFSGGFFGFGGVAKKFTAAHGPLEARGVSEGRAAFTRNLETGVKGIPKALSKVSGRDMLDHGLYWGSQAVTVARSAQMSGTGFGEFRQITADLKGVPHNQVSRVKTALQLLHLAPVDEAAKEARSQFWKSVGPRLAGNAAGMVAFSRLMARGASGKTQALGMLVQIGATGVGEMIGGRNQLLDAYRQVSEGQKHGMFDKGAYLGLIVHAHKADKLDLNDKRIITVARQYEQEKTSAADVLKEITSGTFDQRLAAAPKEAPAAAQTAQSQAETEQATTSARDRLAKGAAIVQPAVGAHTKKENVRRELIADGAHQSADMTGRIMS